MMSGFADQQIVFLDNVAFFDREFNDLAIDFR